MINLYCLFIPSQGTLAFTDNSSSWKGSSGLHIIDLLLSIALNLTTKSRDIWMIIQFAQCSTKAIKNTGQLICNFFFHSCPWAYPFCPNLHSSQTHSSDIETLIILGKSMCLIFGLRIYFFCIKTATYIWFAGNKHYAVWREIIK